MVKLNRKLGGGKASKKTHECHPLREVVSDFFAFDLCLPSSLSGLALWIENLGGLRSFLFCC